MQRGNDITFAWRISDPSGQPIDLSKFDKISMYIQSSSYPSIRVLPEFVIDNGLRFIFEDKDQKASGYYNLVMLAELQGKNYKVDHVRAFELTDHAPMHCEIGDADHMTEISTCLSRYLDGRDGRSPYIGSNGNWFVYDDLLRAFTDTGKLADYADLFALEVKKVTDMLVVADQAILNVNATNEAVIINENARIEEEKHRVANENTRAENERLRVSNDQKRSENEAIRVLNEEKRQTNTTEAIRNTNQAAAKATEQGNAAESKGNTAQIKGAHAENQGNAAERKGDIAEQQGRIAEQQGDVAEQKGNAAALKGSTAAQQGLDAETKGNQAKRDGDYAREQGAAVADEIVQIQQNLGEKLDISTFDMQSRRPQGLKFKSGDAAVFAKNTKKLMLGKEDFTIILIANMVGCFNDMSGSLITGGGNKMGIYGNPKNDGRLNSIQLIRFMKDNAGSLIVNKIDSTTNVHFITISRINEVFKCSVNCKLEKEITLEAVLDFNDFVLDVKNTSLFWGGYVFNCALSEEEQLNLWNGGRYDDTVLNNLFYTKTVFSKHICPLQSVNISWDPASVGNSSEYVNSELIMNCGATVPSLARPAFGIGNGTYGNGVYNLKIKGRLVQGSITLFGFINFHSSGLDATGNPPITAVGDFTLIHTTLLNDTLGNINIYFKPLAPNTIFAISSIELSKVNCLLEYKPTGICYDRIKNIGSLGADYDLLFSDTPPEILYEAPYKDKVMTYKAPDFAPVAMGQEAFDATNGTIYKAALPPLSRDWAVSDWKQINNV